MSEKKILTLENYCLPCEERPFCAVRMAGKGCDPWNELPDAEPIIEAANRYWHDNTSKLHRMDKLRAALDAVEKT